MPFQSKAQQGFLFSKHPEIAKRWAKETPHMAGLPEHAGRKGLQKAAMAKRAKESHGRQG